jgi:AraC-like DNA-binding protein
MLTQDYLTLRLVRLRAQEEWHCEGTGLFFVLIKGGVGKSVLGSTTYRHVEGEVVVLNSNSKAMIMAPDKGEIVFWVFSLNIENLFPLLACNEISLIKDISNVFKGIKTYAPTSQVARECLRLLTEVPPQFNLDHRSQLLRVASAILTLEFKTAQPQRVGFIRVEDHMIQVFERLSTNELLTCSVSELAVKFSCSRRHLNRLFHQHFGLSVAAMRMEMRLIKAVALLRDPDVKVINVAEQCGFNHLGLFNTCFKRRFGTSPGQWRKTLGQDTNQPGNSETNPSTCPLQTTGLCPWSGKPEASKQGGAKAPLLSPATALGVLAGSNNQPPAPADSAQLRHLA